MRVPLFDARFLEYDRLVSYYRSLFGADRVLALAFDQFVEDGRGYVERIAAFAGRPVPVEVLDRLPYGHRENVRTTSMLTLSVVRRLNRLGPRTDVNPAPLAESKLAGRARRPARPAPTRSAHALPAPTSGCAARSTSGRASATPRATPGSRSCSASTWRATAGRSRRDAGPRPHRLPQGGQHAGSSASSSSTARASGWLGKRPRSHPVDGSSASVRSSSIPRTSAARSSR